MKRVYLLLAVVGAIVPYLGFIEFMKSDGVALGGFVAAWFANGAVSGLSADLILSSITFWAFMLSRREAHPAPFVVVNLAIGLSCALPAYLYSCAARESSAALDKAAPAV
ncbi:MAG: DUF2834 domain-containing protein [Pseudomonadota bacterium]